MEKLSEEKLEYFKNKLIEKKENIERQLQEFAQKTQNIKNDYQTKFEKIGDSPDDNADEVANYTDNLALEHALEDNLKEIEAALTRIGDGTYGICTDCNQLMSIERLEAMPEATLCIKCEE